MWLIGAVVCRAAPRVQLFAIPRAVDGRIMRHGMAYHQPMPISCHLRDCKALQLFLSHVSNAIASRPTRTFLSYQTTPETKVAAYRPSVTAYFAFNLHASLHFRYEFSSADNCLFLPCCLLCMASEQKLAKLEVLKIGRKCCVALMHIYKA